MYGSARGAGIGTDAAGSGAGSSRGKEEAEGVYSVLLDVLLPVLDALDAPIALSPPREGGSAEEGEEGKEGGGCMVAAEGDGAVDSR